MENCLKLERGMGQCIDCPLVEMFQMVNTSEDLVVIPQSNLVKMNNITSCDYFSEHIFNFFRDKKSLYIDLSKVDFIDSTGVSLLVTLYKMARKHDIYFSLCNVNYHILSLLEVVKLRKILFQQPAQALELGA